MDYVELSILNYKRDRFQFGNIHEWYDTVRDDLSRSECQEYIEDMLNSEEVYWGHGENKRFVIQRIWEKNGYKYDKYEGLEEAIKGGKRTKGGGGENSEGLVIPGNDNRKVKQTWEETQKYREELKLWTEAHGEKLPSLR